MKGFISSTNRSPESISTPEPLYVRELFLVFSVIVLSAGMKYEIECVSLHWLGNTRVNLKLAICRFIREETRLNNSIVTQGSV